MKRIPFQEAKKAKGIRRRTADVTWAGCEAFEGFACHIESSPNNKSPNHTTAHSADTLNVAADP